MVVGGALQSVVGSSVIDSHTSPCLCLLDLMKRKQLVAPRHFGSGSLDLGSSFLDSWHDWKGSSASRVVLHNLGVVASRRSSKKLKRLVVVNELGGQYEDTFGDVKLQLLNYFTYKAVRTVLNQLYEMNPAQYRWFYNFVAANKPGDGKRFIQTLGKEKQDLAERVMVTRLHLYGKWIKKCNHAEIYQEISDENLELMRERLMETVIWPSDDTTTNTEKI